MGSIAKLRVGAIIWLYGACTNVVDRRMAVQQRSYDCAMSWREFWWFLEQDDGTR